MSFEELSVDGSPTVTNCIKLCRMSILLKKECIKVAKFLWISVHIGLHNNAVGQATNMYHILQAYFVMLANC